GSASRTAHSVQSEGGVAPLPKPSPAYRTVGGSTAEMARMRTADQLPSPHALGMSPRAGASPKSLRARAWLALAALALALGLLLFVSAGGVRYWQAWVYLSIFMGASALTTRSLLRRDPALLERRMRGGPTAEQRPVQKFIMLWTSVGFIALLVVPALDYRF